MMHSTFCFCLGVDWLQWFLKNKHETYLPCPTEESLVCRSFTDSVCGSVFADERGVLHSRAPSYFGTLPPVTCQQGRAVCILGGQLATYHSSLHPQEIPCLEIEKAAIWEEPDRCPCIPCSSANTPNLTLCLASKPEQEMGRDLELTGGNLNTVNPGIKTMMCLEVRHTVVSLFCCYYSLLEMKEHMLWTCSH